MLTYTRQCATCSEVKPLTDFPRRRGKRVHNCLPCLNVLTAEAERLGILAKAAKDALKQLPPDPLAAIYRTWLASCDGRKLVGFAT